MEEEIYICNECKNMVFHYEMMPIISKKLICKQCSRIKKPKDECVISLFLFSITLFILFFFTL